MKIPLDDILIVLGAGVALFALWALCWQAGLVGTGLAIIAVAYVVRGVLRKQKKRRGG